MAPPSWVDLHVTESLVTASEALEFEVTAAVVTNNVSLILDALVQVITVFLCSRLLRNALLVGTTCGLCVCGFADLQIGSAVATAW